ncbi:MAG: hypothetical protein ABI129_06805 [Rhodanobacter sp.]
MNDSAYDMTYDVSHLLDAALPQAEAPAPRVMRAVTSAPAKPSVTEAQEALARELMQAAVIHDALVQQYLRMRPDTFQGSGNE